MSTVPLPSQLAKYRTPYTLGMRSTEVGGKWHKCRLPPTGSCPVSSEPASVLAQIPGVWKHIARARYEEMWDKAAEGKLKFGKHEEVGPIHRHPPLLLEMRVQINEKAKEASKRFLLRLYFAEPEAHHGLILALYFAKKPSGTDPDHVQDRHIDEALRRHRVGAEKQYLWGITK